MRRIGADLIHEHPSKSVLLPIKTLVFFENYADMTTEHTENTEEMLLVEMAAFYLPSSGSALVGNSSKHFNYFTSVISVYSVVCFGFVDYCEIISLESAGTSGKK